MNAVTAIEKTEWIAQPGDPLRAAGKPPIGYASSDSYGTCQTVHEPVSAAGKTIPLHQLNMLERAPRPDLGDYTFNVMAPLLVGDPKNVHSPQSQAAWREFEGWLREAKKNGAEAVSTDVWWGLIEPHDNEFDWSYYDRMADAIEAADLCWVPILSFHRCGGNVGDDANVPIPSFLAEKYEALGEDGPFFRSEQGHVSRESLSVWASRVALNEYRDVMSSFQQHFGHRAGNISEINISLGPAGELRYPSYNSHDQNADYPSRGALQSYSKLALDSFRAYVLDEYGSMEAVSSAWGFEVTDIRPPDDPGGFFGRGDHVHMQYGRDFFDWYNQSLLEHGRALLTTAVETFNGPNAAFAGVDIGAKVPGVHWRMGADRAAELDAGLIRTSDASTRWPEGRGYEPIIELFAELRDLPNAPEIVLHFTCLEMDDGAGGPDVGSRARSLVRNVVRTARKYGVPVKGENALPVWDGHQWDNIESAIQEGYSGLTVLRLPLSPENLHHLGRLSATYQ